MKTIDTHRLRISLDPAHLDELRGKSCSRRLGRWERVFAEEEALENWRIRDLADALGFWGHLPVEKLTGAAEITLYHNPRSRGSMALGGGGYRIEDIAMALAHLRWAGVDMPVLPLIEALRQRLRKKKMLTQCELDALWMPERDRAAFKRIILIWPAGEHAEIFKEPSVKRLKDGRISLRGSNRAGEGVELICDSVTSKAVKELLWSLGLIDFAVLARKELLTLVDEPFAPEHPILTASKDRKGAEPIVWH